MNSLPTNQTILLGYNVMRADDFSAMYPVLNDILERHGRVEKIRSGEVKELLNFKTILTNPIKRCVGGYGRNVNIFFLLAEAMWIFSGRKDVRFLDIFNSNMKNFSDDGEVFHAPYGFRIRHWGVASESKFVQENMHAAQGSDQLYDVIKLLQEDPSTNQAVMSIWNPDLDLGTKSKDIPCNDLVMFKVRDGKLNTTIANRSNDLHWGLTTNIFQFGFMSEIIASVLNCEIGEQVHNSQSLHAYNWNALTSDMIAKVKKSGSNANTLYSKFEGGAGAEPMQMDFKFKHDVATNRLREVDYYIATMIRNLETLDRTGKVDYVEELSDIKEFSEYLYLVFCILSIYVGYKKKRITKMEAYNNLKHFSKKYKNLDILVLAMNFFATRLNIVEGSIGTL